MKKIDWIEIPEGKFLMGLSEDQVQELTRQMSGRVLGDPEDILAMEIPQYLVHVPTFYISRFPITHKQFAEFTRDSYSQFDIPAYHVPEWADHPVTGPWHHARAFCAWIGARLPSSIEWEKAARGTDGLLYPWGNQWDLNRGNFGQRNRRGRTQGIKSSPVGVYPEGASPYGVCDMVGNGYEWTMTLGVPIHKSRRYAQKIIIRGSDPDADALYPAYHRVTGIMAGGVSYMSWPPYTGFRPVMDEWQQQHWPGFTAKSDEGEQD